MDSAASHISSDASDGMPNSQGLVNGSSKSLPNGSAAIQPGAEMLSSSKGETPQSIEVFDLGFELTDLYKHALKFYKDYESKAFTPSYEDRNKLAALILQSKHGAIDSDKEPQLGVLDFVGRDRTRAWLALGSMSSEESMRQFVSLLNHLCPAFIPYIEAHAKERDELRKREELESHRLSRERENRLREEELKQFESQKKAVQELLNRQTYSQFLAYAEQQYPSEPEKQQHLIHQLQEQHYQQYMQQMLQLQPFQPSSSSSASSQVPGSPSCSSSSASTVTDLPTKSLLTASGTQQSYQSIDRCCDKPVQATLFQADEEDGHSDRDAGDESVVVEAAKLWTRPEIDAFKESIRKEGAEGMISVNHGEVVTIKVPTHEDGSCIYWEFCTDTYDIGFGVLFEWTEHPGNQMSVHVSETEDDEEEDAVELEDRGADPERVAAASYGSEISQDVIIPVFRRDSHEEVFVGSHPYPGRGVYHLKFDNTYSLWRSKTLYYRVYYTH